MSVKRKVTVPVGRATMSGLRMGEEMAAYSEVTFGGRQYLSFAAQAVIPIGCDPPLL